jgi:predicted ABC-type transport system involved in lysophospholipase L1 biosynthesis ATPase subunit
MSQEAAGLLLEEQPYHTGGAVAVLADVDLGAALHRVALGVGLHVDLGAVDEKHHVGILLDGPGVAQVGQHGNLVAAALFHLAAELRQGDHGNLELLGQALQRLGHGGHAQLVVLGVGQGHQLQVVEHQQVQLVAV